MTASLLPIGVAARDQAGTPYYGLVWLALASLAYTDESSTDMARVGVDLPNAVGALSYPPAPLIQDLPPQYHSLISTQLADRVAAYPLPDYKGACVQVPPAAAAGSTDAGREGNRR
jgi:hypothetical protein